MNTNELVKSKFADLLADGRQILGLAGWDGQDYNRNHPSGQDYIRFRTEALNLIRRACGENSDHYSELQKLSKAASSAANGYWFYLCYGVLEAAAKDFSEGMLFDLRSLIAAELLGDFIDQAEYLYSEKFYSAAASLAGAVLEDTLRKLSSKHGITVPAKTKLNSLNAELARAQVYNTLVQKRITALADIRNNADHGHHDRFKPADVEDMIVYIKRFTADYLG